MSKKGKKISKIQILRIIVQILSLIIIPGIFVVTLSEIKEIYISIIDGKFNITTILSMIELIAIIPITAIIGRFFCGWICAFGAFNDFIYMISKKVFKLKYKIPESIDSKLKYAKYGVLLFLIIFVWTMGSKTLDGTSPWDAFAQLPNISVATKEYTIGFILLVLITIGALFIERFFCRYLCPLGAIFSLLSKVRILNISKTKDKCGKCRICTNNCAMGIPMYKFDKIVSGECINCFKCVDVCPRQNTKVTILGKEVTAKVASSTSLVLFTILYGSANALEHVIESKSMYVSQQGSLVSSSKNSKYKDGVYRGIGKGYKEGLELEVTIKNDKIEDIKVVKDNETPSFFKKAWETVKNAIIEKQSTEVDGVSGATRTSDGIKEAVNVALDKASNKKESKYKDGVYTGIGKGYKEGLELEVTIKNDKIEDIKVVKDNETPSFFKKAWETVKNAIIEKQSTEVDGVSGATRSSDGIKEAVNVALDKASNKKESKYKDGAYTGIGEGYKEGLELEVTIKNDKIEDIKVVKDNETPSFFKKAWETVKNAIIEKQSTEVDGVSGATRTSDGIKEAVDMALDKASINVNHK